MSKSAAKKPTKPASDSKTPAIMIMIGLAPDAGMGKEKPAPSMRGKVPGFGGKTRRSYVGP